MIKASVVQACTVGYSLSNTLDKLEHFLVVFPEAFIGGYPKMSTFGAVVGDRSPEGREEFLRYYNAAIDSVSKELGVFIVVGVIERDGGTLYCTVLFISPQDGFVGKHRKLMPTASERLIWGFGDGSTLPVVEAKFNDTLGAQASAKLSATICWCLNTSACQLTQRSVRTYYYSQGTQIYCAPTVDARPVWQNTMTHIAIEGRCFVLSAYHPVADTNNRKPDNIMIAGGSVIINPLGKLDLDDCIRGKFDLDVVGHYARPDGEIHNPHIVDLC
ncbi:Nitrilase [Salix suchowensis]|nr:Nitrilase [Salix suchowensis]